MDDVKFLDLSGLTYYDEKIKKLIAIPSYINDYKVNINDDKTSGSSNLFQCDVLFAVYFKGDINDDSTMTVHAYDVNMEYTGQLTTKIKDLPIKDGFYTWALNPIEEDCYFKIDWNALSCNMMFSRLKINDPSTISINEINDLW